MIPATYVRARAVELREIARQVALLGLPRVTTARTADRLRQIAQEIENPPEHAMTLRRRGNPEARH